MYYKGRLRDYLVLNNSEFILKQESFLLYIFFYAFIRSQFTETPEILNWNTYLGVKSRHCQEYYMEISKKLPATEFG